MVVEVILHDVLSVDIPPCSTQDKKKRYFLVTAAASTKVDLKGLHGRLS